MDDNLGKDRDDVNKSPNPESSVKPAANISDDIKAKCQTSSAPIQIKGSYGVKVKKLECHAPSKQPFDSQQPQESTDASGIMVDTDGNPIPLDKIIKTVNTMSSMMMAHKIALEDDFKLEPGMDISGPLMSLSPIIGSSPKSKGFGSGGPSEPSLQTKVKDIVHDAYWDLFKSEIAGQSSENKEERVFDISKQLLRDIKQKIFELLLPQHTRLKQDIDEKLDSQVIDQLAQVDSLDLADYAKYILDTLSKLCAPVRDERLKELSETTDIVQVYKGIMELLELMRLDFANFTLNRFKPHIKAHSQDYEREKFTEILKQQQSIGIDGLEYTKIWLQRAVNKVDSLYGIADIVNETNSSDVDNEELMSASNLLATNSTTIKNEDSKLDKIFRSDIINKVLNTGYCELLEWSQDKQRLYPETLLFDEATFKQLGEQYKVLVLTSSILLTLFAFVNRYKLQDNEEFKRLTKSHVITLLTATYDNDSTKSATSSSTAKTNTSVEDGLDQIKLETIAARLILDIRQKLEESNKGALDNFEKDVKLFTGQILDLANSANRIKELSKRRIMEFVETLLSIDVKHQQKKISSKLAPPVNIPLGLNCLADEITLTMAQLVKIIRYNRKVFFQHYQDIIVDLVSKII